MYVTVVLMSPPPHPFCFCHSLDFMPQFEVGQQELVDVHHYTYLIDICTMSDLDPALVARVQAANKVLAKHIFFSTQKRTDYNEFLTTEEFKKSKKYFRFFLNSFMSVEFLSEFVGLGFDNINPKEKEINSLTQTVFYSSELMRMQSNRQEYDFQVSSKRRTCCFCLFP
jgi:hypothetical protein